MDQCLTARKTTPDLRKHADRACNKMVGLTWHNPNTLVLAEGPEISIKPVGIRRVSAGEAR
jgi:hypothetical protein